ncbi:hypothetical protein LTR53_017166 [Teratosphaeriaceae sp. CCFEE 6253]|nr:hypothetical protein LTR53_017166 [Teratosphaeriaceae sp. CCFEE 6253]
MCIERLAYHGCGHTERQYFNQHCHCALIVGPIEQTNDSCARRCGAITPTKSAAQAMLTPPETPPPTEKQATTTGNMSTIADDAVGGAQEDGTLHAALWGQDRKRYS